MKERRSEWGDRVDDNIIGYGRDEEADNREPSWFQSNHVRDVITPQAGVRDADASNEIRDRNWMRASFHYISDLEEQSSIIDKYEHGHRKGFGIKFAKVAPATLSSKYARAYRGWQDTTLGGNFPINTAYSFTSYADVKMDRAIETIGSGMGYYYWDSIDRNAHDIHIRFGHQKFSTGTKFFSQWFDYYSFHIATFGRAPSIMFELGQVAGLAMGFVMPSVLIAGWLLKAFNLLGGGRFAYLAPTMPLYWSTVNNIFNEITAAMGLTLPPGPSDAVKALKKGGNSGFRELSYIGTATNMLPEIYSNASGSTEEGFAIDVRRVAGRAQRLENQVNDLLQKRIADIKTDQLKDITPAHLTEMYDQALAEVSKGGYGLESDYDTGDERVKNKKSTRSYLTAYLKTKQGSASIQQYQDGKSLFDQGKLPIGNADNTSADPDSMESIYDFTGVTGAAARDINIDVDNLHKTGVAGDNESLYKLAINSLRDGSDWLTLRVNGTGSIGESFSNSSEQSQLAGAVNGWAQQRRQLSFNFMGGALLGGAIEGILGGLTDMAAGMLDSINLSGLTGLIMGAKIDIPKTYSSSSTSLPSKSYTIKLRTPYKHPLAIAQDLYLPMACLLAGALPMSAGKNAYSNPFFVEVYDRGRNVTKFGLISSLSIERGTSGVGWTHEGLPLGIDITFSIENLDEVAHIPVNTFSTLGDLLNPGAVLDTILMGNEGAFADYISTLSGLSLPDQIYRSNNIKRNWYSYTRKWNDYWDIDNFLPRIMNSSPVRWMTMFTDGTARR